jgi:lipopolysaccharide/colanic/teichoic acid biosynthesis glycosyltransferase
MTAVGGSSKRALDLALSAPLLLILSPLLVGLAVAVKLDSPGPALYRAQRCGYGGCPFTMYKLRTMVDTGDRDNSSPLTISDDQRLTRAGRWLRRTRLDELPQIYNVIKGEMSLVGPRPEDTGLVALYTVQQRRVLDCRPGVTGLSQLHFKDEALLLSRDDPTGGYVERILPRKVALDLYYLERRSLFLDLRIIARTLFLPLKKMGRSTR